MHRCICPTGQEYTVLIDGDSVQLGLKSFDTEEIEQLKQIKGSQKKSTYDIFQRIDRETKACNLEMVLVKKFEDWHYTGTLDSIG